MQEDNKSEQDAIVRENDNAEEDLKENIELLPPNNTIYINNLNEKIHIDVLKEELYNIFSNYGVILDVIAKRNIRMRGQAFIVFEELSSAIQAVKEMQNYNFYQKQMRINFAKEKSDIIAKKEGTFVIREKQKNKPEPLRKNPEKKLKTDQTNQKNIVQPSKPANKHTIIPNNILFCENLPPNVGVEVLNSLFQQYPGFREVRLIPIKNVAFIEYEEEYQAGLALSGLIGTRLGDNMIQLNYAKR